MNFKNLIRTWLGIRTPRQLLPIGDKPQVGSSLVLKSLRMQLDHPITQEFWEWLSQTGWRVNDIPNDRRRYSMVSDDVVQQLMTANMEERTDIHAYLMRVIIEREPRLKHSRLSFMQKTDDRHA